jgi:hypothetical protein
MNHLNLAGFSRAAIHTFAIAVITELPNPALAQSSPFLTGATALQSNIIAWLTPIAVILIMALGGMAMANRIVENCGNTLILRCSSSEGGGTSRFASRLIGEREVLRTTESKSRRPSEWLASTTRSEQFSTEAALLPSQIEQLPDLAGFLKLASRPEWLRVTLAHGARRTAAANSPQVRARAKRTWNQWCAEHHGERNRGSGREFSQGAGPTSPHATDDSRCD